MLQKLNFLMLWKMQIMFNELVKLKAEFSKLILLIMCK